MSTQQQAENTLTWDENTALSAALGVANAADRGDAVREVVERIVASQKAAAVEAALAPVRALADEWEERSRGDYTTLAGSTKRACAAGLRAVLPPAPTEGGGDRG